jgi:hypothetical protein
VNSTIKNINVPHDWPDGFRLNEYHEKLPTRIAYPEENSRLGKIIIDYEVTSGMKSYTWMKLLLAGNVGRDNVTNRSVEDKARHGMLELPRGKTAQQVVTDYLKCLHEHIMGHLAEERPGELMSEIDFWFTTPACWDNKANSLMLECALRAGFGARVGDRAYVMSEPEAALIASLSTSIDKHEGIYKVLSFTEFPQHPMQLNIDNHSPA